MTEIDNPNQDLVRFELPSYAHPTNEAFDGADVTVEYDSNYNGYGETITVSGAAKLSKSRYPSDWDTLVVADRHVRSNRHVFNNDGRHLGTVTSMTVTAPAEIAIELVTESVDHDVDRGDEAIIVQTWDTGVIEQEGFIAGTDSIRLERV